MSDDIYLARFEYAKLTEQAAIPVIIVTANQDDYPRRYVARLWDMSVPTSTQTWPWKTPWKSYERQFRLK